ncbi:MAG: alkaline phosphatase family protein [Flavobacteriaceae bacterium]|nr:alkaline phosphatase family protein [Flavobacteriaceae bacterium]
MKCKIKLQIILVSLWALSLGACTEKSTKTVTTIESNENYVILLSLDGFRYDYIDKYDAQNLKNIAERGVRVLRMNPSNPTKTFPNHYTLVTGLYPDNHGLIGNSFFDAVLGKYSLRDRKAVENGKFYGGEPIWNTAQKAGLKTASYFWVGSEAKIKGRQPDIWKKYDGKVSFESRIDSVVNWLKLPKGERPRLITLYYHEPDGAGHHYGANSEQVAKQVKYVDKQVGNLYKKLMDLPIAKNINFIVVSDHGMRELDGTKNIILEDYVDKKDVLGIYGGNPAYTLRIKKGKVNKVYEQLKKVPHLNVFKRGNAPQELHLANHIRTNDMMLIAEKGYALYPFHLKAKSRIGKKYGVHGYLNTDEQMGATFVAVGNAFKVGYKQQDINNVDVYNLLAFILGIKPATNDGNFENVKMLLKK